MMPYFFAAGHFNYARYGLYYLPSMERLPPELLTKFMKSQHVMRHSPGLWNGMWSDMYIETTFMRYGHGPGALVGITLNPSATRRWALSLHIRSRLIKDLSNMRDANLSSNEVTVHKEEKIREKIREKLQTCIDPLNPDGHCDGIVDIASGRISPAAVNVDNAISLGEDQMRKYQESWPEGFHAPLSSNVKTMTICRKRVKLGAGSTFDTELIYSRVMGIMNSRDISIENIFGYELAPIPTSLFEDDGSIRVAKTKSTLKKKLQVEQSVRTVEQHDVTILDGCAILWIIHWPQNGTVQGFINSLLSFVLSRLVQSDVYLVFDRYYEYSIKGTTRSYRAGSLVSGCHQIRADAPLTPRNVILSVTENKVQLIDIMCQQIPERVSVLQAINTGNNHRLVLTGPSPTPQEVSQGIVIQRGDLKTSHEEVDVIIAQQMVKVATQGTKCIKVICDDTDVFVLLLHYYAHSKLTCTVVMEGTSAQRGMINIGQTALNNASIVPHLLAAHALTGCDTVGCLRGIGKVTAIKNLSKGLKLDSIGEPNSDMDLVIAQATSFLAACLLW